MAEKIQDSDKAAQPGAANLSDELRNIIHDSTRIVHEASAEPQRRGRGRPPGAKNKNKNGELNNESSFSDDSGGGGGEYNFPGNIHGDDPPPASAAAPRYKANIGSKSFQTIFRALHKIAAVRTGYSGFALEPELAEDMGNSAEAAGRDWMPAMPSKYVSLLVFAVVAGCVVLMKMIDWLEWKEGQARPAAAPAQAAGSATPASSPAPTALLPYRPILPVGRRS